MTGRARLLIGLAVLAFGAGCGGGAVTLVPHGRPTAQPTGRARHGRREQPCPDHRKYFSLLCERVDDSRQQLLRYDL
jgi:hypothetical protein